MQTLATAALQGNLLARLDSRAWHHHRHFLAICRPNLQGKESSFVVRPVSYQRHVQIETTGSPVDWVKKACRHEL